MVICVVTSQAHVNIGMGRKWEAGGRRQNWASLWDRAPGGGWVQKASLGCSLDINQATEKLPSLSHSGPLHPLDLPTLSSLTARTVLLSLDREAHIYVWCVLGLPQLASRFLDRHRRLRQGEVLTHSHSGFLLPSSPASLLLWFPRTQKTPSVITPGLPHGLHL